MLIFVLNFKKPRSLRSRIKLPMGIMDSFSSLFPLRMTRKLKICAWNRSRGRRGRGGGSDVRRNSTRARLLRKVSFCIECSKEVFMESSTVHVDGYWNKVVNASNLKNEYKYGFSVPKNMAIDTPHDYFWIRSFFRYFPSIEKCCFLYASAL